MSKRDALSTESYKGTRDFYPDDMQFRNWMFGQLSHVVRSYGFREYMGPMLESFDLYAAKTGEEIVNQQLYSMIDRGDRRIAVRPEMTPTMARMVAARLNELPKPIRWFSVPNLWRYERPQRGRLREHWQLNVDVLGGDTLLADTEILSLAIQIMNQFGGGDQIQIRVNHRQLMDAFFSGKLGLTTEQAQKVVKAIDAKDKVAPEKFQTWLQEAGVSDAQVQELELFFKSSLDELSKTLPCEGVTHLIQLFESLQESGVKVGAQVVFDPTIMRGLDYYTGTVFEMVDLHPENRRAIFGGGRYDNLMGIFGKSALSGVGFGMGDVSLQNFLETHQLVPKFESELDVFVALDTLARRVDAEKICASLRACGFTVMTPLAEGSFGSQLKMASKHQCKFAVLFGEDEWKQGKVVVKDLRSGDQAVVEVADVAAHVQKLK